MCRAISPAVLQATVGSGVAAESSAAAGDAVLIADWLAALRERQHDLTLAPQWAWISAVAGGLQDKLRAVAVSDGGSSPGFGSFLEYEDRQLGIALLTREMPGCQLVSYHSALVAGRAADVLVDALLTHDGRPCDLLYLPEVERGAATDLAITELAARRNWFVLRRPGLRAPYLPLAADWDTFLAQRSSNFRYTLRRKQKALGEVGKVTEEWFTDEQSVAALLGHVREIEEASWKVNASMAISRSAKETTYYQLLLPWLARERALQGNVVYVDGRPAAYSLCYVWQGRMAQMKTSFNEAFARASPGLVSTAATIRKAHELGLGEFDFLGDMMPHKAVWTNLTRDHDHLFVYTGRARGRIVGLMKKVISALRPRNSIVTVGRSGHKPDAASG
jgi:CelD/BcsL family acetyltransferase involved in cellulose biosynthesis